MINGVGISNMLADQKIGKSFMGTLAYNLKKLKLEDSNRRAELLETNLACPKRGVIWLSQSSICSTQVF